LYLKAIESGQDVSINEFFDWNETQKQNFNNYHP